ncbi:hypothetical protein ACAX43_31190 [Paraburkholderia sp. IW21]|uniref:hypothetical protein n=1 Tax=Paraburkholderia sp. IW21 TaxID=3242488 RepID=UPI003522114E
MNRTPQEGNGSLPFPRPGNGLEQENDGFVRIGVDVVFHPDVLKTTVAKGRCTRRQSCASTKKPMSLELDDWW